LTTREGTDLPWALGPDSRCRLETDAPAIQMFTKVGERRSHLIRRNTLRQFRAAAHEAWAAATKAA